MVTQHGARIDQKWSQNGEKCAELPKVATRWLPRPFYPKGGIDFEQFLASLRNPKVHQKLIFCDKGCSKERRFIDFCGKYRFSRFSGGLLIDFSWKIDEKTNVFFSQPRVFFSNWRPSRNTVFYDTKATFLFFAVLVFSSKNGQKSSAKEDPEKSSKK